MACSGATESILPMSAAHDPSFATRAARGFDLAYRAHVEAIVIRDFPQAAKELERILSGVVIPVTELIAGGGGEAKGTQRLRRVSTAAGWRKHRFDVEKRIDGVPAQSRPHEVDHVRSFDGGGRIALEIEWNNKDPFSDRDLEHFQRLHADGAISVGIIDTRGRSLRDGLSALVRDLLERNDINASGVLAAFGYKPTDRQRDAIRARADRRLPGCGRARARLGQDRRGDDALAQARGAHSAWCRQPPSPGADRSSHIGRGVLLRSARRIAMQRGLSEVFGP